MRIIKNIKLYILIFLITYVYYFLFRNQFFGLITISPFDMTYQIWYTLVALPCMIFSGSVFFGYLLKEKFSFSKYHNILNYLSYIALITFMTILITGIGITTSCDYLSIINTRFGYFVVDIAHFYPEVYFLLGVATSLNIKSRK